ncbi:MAG: hypothetical protein JWM57_1679 [Phycisphaerales bacterium]|nr:hypothetical protein [Phycisphaerales bacterium]
MSQFESRPGELSPGLLHLMPDSSRDDGVLFAINLVFVDKLYSVRRVVMLLSVLAVGWSAGCAPKGRGLLDEDVAFKAPAIKEAVVDRQKAAVPQLVKDLDDDDSAVRFYAIEGLRRLTGQTFDYHYFDDTPARAPAVAKWQAWLAEHVK